MRILYLHPRAWSGEYALLKTLRRRGHHVCVLEEWRGEPRPPRFATDHFLEPGDGIPSLWYDPHQGWEKALTWPVDRLLKRAFSGRNFAHRMWLIRAAVARFRPDVVVTTDGFTYALPAAWLKRFGLMRTPLVASFIGGDILDCAEVHVGRRRTPLVNALIRGALPAIDVLRPVSPLLQEILIEDGADPARIRVVPSHLAIDVAACARQAAHRDDAAAAVRARHGLPADARLLVTLSHNYAAKGPQVLADQWRRVKAACPQAHWLLCGPRTPWLEREVRPVIEASGAADAVTFTGPLTGDAVLEYLAAAELNVSPSLCEGLNMVTVEAAAVGTPTVTGDGAGIAAWVGRCGAGAVVPSGDAEALGAAVVRALADDALLAGWRAACPVLVAEFTQEHVAAALEDLFRLAAA